MKGQQAGRWISLEGIDGCGKTTVARGLRDWLLMRGYTAICTSDPPDTVVGYHVRELVKNFKLENLTQAMLIAAARSDNYHKYVKPVLDEGRIVISDRNFHTSLIYQPDCTEDVFLLHDLGIGRYPDRVFVLDVPVEVAYDRIADNKDACEDVPIEEWERRRQGFINLMGLADVTVIKCGDDSRDEVMKKVIKHVNSFLGKGGFNDEACKEL